MNPSHPDHYTGVPGTHSRVMETRVMVTWGSWLLLWVPIYNTYEYSEVLHTGTGLSTFWDGDQLLWKGIGCVQELSVEVSSSLTSRNAAKHSWFRMARFGKTREGSASTCSCELVLSLLPGQLGTLWEPGVSNSSRRYEQCTNSMQIAELRILQYL